jgi:hypothetical protein
MVQRGDGIGIALDGGVAVINPLIQRLDFVPLDGLIVPLVKAKAAEREREADE